MKCRSEGSSGPARRYDAIVGLSRSVSCKDCVALSHLSLSAVQLLPGWQWAGSKLPPAQEAAASSLGSLPLEVVAHARRTAGRSTGQSTCWSRCWQAWPAQAGGL
jgi:hypothetical protein